MEPQYRKAQSIKLKDVDKDEKWLQERITEDPSILGLGDLVILQREHKQPSGGRIDFLMYDPDDSIRYEIEIMLGTLDESHIIRTIEYWDIERRRYPSLEHRAVIVAEEITNRFFNVISLLNRAVPIIALQLNAFLLDNSLILNFVRVLDLVEEEDEEEVGSHEQVDRRYWESKSGEKSLQIMDRMIEMVQANGDKPRVTYNRYHVALGTTGTNFCWFHLRKSAHSHMHIKVGTENKDSILTALDQKGLESGTHKKDVIKLVLTVKELEENSDYVSQILKLAEERSHR